MKLSASLDSDQDHGAGSELKCGCVTALGLRNPTVWGCTRMVSGHVGLLSLLFAGVKARHDGTAAFIYTWKFFFKNKFNIPNVYTMKLMSYELSNTIS